MKIKCLLQFNFAKNSTIRLNLLKDIFHSYSKIIIIRSRFYNTLKVNYKIWKGTAYSVLF